MKALILVAMLAGSTSFAADVPAGTSGPTAPSTHPDSMPGSKQAQMDSMKKDVMDKCMMVKKNETTCKDMMKSCGETKLQSCMNDKLGTMKH